MLGVKEIIRNLVAKSGVKNEAQLAHLWGKADNYFSLWKKRGSANLREVISYCEVNGFDIKEVLQGPQINAEALNRLQDMELRLGIAHADLEGFKQRYELVQRKIVELYGEEEAARIFPAPAWGSPEKHYQQPEEQPYTAMAVAEKESHVEPPG